MGLMNMAFATYTYHYVSEAAREGVRYAVVRGGTTTTPATPDSVETYVRSLAYPGITASNLTVATSWSAYPTSVTTCAPLANCKNPGDLVTVVATYAFPVQIPFFPSKTINMTSTSSMVIAQ